MKTYIEVTFKSMKIYWFFVLFSLAMSATMKWYFIDDTTALVLLLLAIFMVLVNLIGSYIYIKKNNL